MSAEINNIIDNLCQKLGTTATFLIPEMAKMHIAQLVIQTLFWLAVTACAVWFIPKAWRYDHREKDSWTDESFWIIVPGTVSFIGAVGLICYATELAGWVASPTAKSISIIAGMVK